MAEEAVSTEATTESVLTEEAPSGTSIVTETAEVVEEQSSQEAESQSKEQDSTADKVKDGAPDEYEAFNIPEGMEIDEQQLELFVPVAKELNLTQEQAQKLADLQTGYVQKAVEQQERTWEKTVTEWRDSAETDQEIGGSGFKENVAHAKKFLENYGTPELMNALDLTGVGNHPEFIRAFAKAGKAMSEDKMVVSGQQPGEKKTQAETLFPDMN